MDCSTPDASHYAGCACNEERRQNEVARLTRERDEARERAAGLSRELLAAIQARDSYRMSAERRVGMRRECEALLGCGDTVGDEAFARGLARLRGLLAAESRAERLAEALFGLVDERDPETLRKMAAMLRLAGRTAEANACAALGEDGKS